MYDLNKMEYIYLTNIFCIFLAQKKFSNRIPASNIQVHYSIILTFFFFFTIGRILMTVSSKLYNDNSILICHILLFTESMLIYYPLCTNVTFNYNFYLTKLLFDEYLV